LTLEVKRCFACAEEILQEAKLCKHCGTWQADSIPDSIDVRKAEEIPNGQQPRAKTRSKKNVILIITVCMVAIGGVSAAAIVWLNEASARAEREVTAKAEISSFCGAVLKGAWRGVRLQDVQDAQLAYLVSGDSFANFRDIVLPEVKPFEVNAQLARELPYFKSKSVGGELGQLMEALDDKRATMQDSWAWLSTPEEGKGVGAYIIFPTRDNYSSSENTKLLDEVRLQATLARDSMQYLQVECERFIASGN
jgi:hypothetical protein